VDRSELAIVIPAYNEEAAIARVVSGISKLGKAIVVDDCSEDGTALAAERAGATVVRHERNMGYDGALDSGFRQAEKLQFRYAVTMDADGQHAPSQLSAFVERLDQGFSLVLGVRDRRQRFSEHLFAWTTRLLYGIHDPLCGMKGYSMDVYRSLGHFDSYGSIGTELALYAVRQGFRFCELPVATRPRQGASRFGQFLRGNYLILRALLLGLLRTRPTGRHN
jgi:glycosyltransferase involved in cell wall biosynthesis